MFLFLTKCVILASAWFEKDLYEILPSKGECPEGKIVDDFACKYIDFGPCDVDCWGGDLDSTTHGCGCIINNDGKRYYNEPSGKSCKAGEEASMVCKKELTSTFVKMFKAGLLIATQHANMGISIKQMNGLKKLMATLILPILPLLNAPLCA